MYYDGFLVSFDAHYMEPMQSMCKLLYAVFDHVLSVENMADISIEVNEINVVSVERKMMPFELIASIS